VRPHGCGKVMRLFKLVGQDFDFMRGVKDLCSLVGERGHCNGGFSKVACNFPKLGRLGVKCFQKGGPLLVSQTGKYSGKKSRVEHI
jgi:hypothetical protein